MKLHIVTIGKPKLAYAKIGWEEYLGRLRRFHDIRLTQLADKFASDGPKLLESTQGSYRVGLVIEGKELSSQELAQFLEARALEGREVSFVIGGPDGLPVDFQAACDLRLSFSPLTFPHDLAMVVLLETLYRSSTINAGTPYHH